MIFYSMRSATVGTRNLWIVYYHDTVGYHEVYRGPWLNAVICLVWCRKFGR